MPGLGTKMPHAVGQLILHAKTRKSLHTVVKTQCRQKIKEKMQYVFKNNKLQVERVET